jgi:[glutamine synthetase] adenylyltransferase / [glutamine synthetase]-adenylyl-L-tyrosine phosphorylase
MVINAKLRETIETLCPEVDREIIRDFFARMDEDYFAVFSQEEICTHLRMSSALNPGHPVECKVKPRGDGEFDIIIVGLDYLSEFSIICGLLSAFGLDIRAGNIYSFAKHEVEGPQSLATRRRQRSRPARPLPRKIVDVFRVRLKPGETFVKTAEFEEELHTLIRLLATGSSEQARERLNRFLTERIEEMNEQLSGLLSPVEVRFDNLASADWTVMDVHSRDAFAFLYAFSNALAMRGIYIHKVKIQSIGREVRDQFFIADRWGRKIEDEREQERLRTAVILIKQFTQFLPEAPDPARAMRHFDQFLDKISEDEVPDQIVSFFTGRKGMNLLAHLLGSSDFLWDDFLRQHFKDFLPVLEALTGKELRPGKQILRQQLFELLAAGGTFDEKKKIFNEFKDRQLFLIDVKHLLEPQVTLIDFSHALTELSEVVLDEAARICYAQLAEQYGEPVLEWGSPCPYTICGLGKFGGREMGYASDLEIVFFFRGPGRTTGGLENGQFYDLLVQRVVEFIESRNQGVFHIDLRLRPHGKSGPLAIHFGQLISYYSESGDAAPFEKQALIKLRWVAGDEPLGREVESHRDRYTYSGAPWDWKNAIHLRGRQTRELIKPGEINVKYSPGGIIAIEYAVQYQQIIYGKDHAELRTTSTLEALSRLCNLRLIDQQEHDDLRAAYLFLRNLIDALRIVRGDASDLVLPAEESEEFKSLARRLGYREQERRRSAERLTKDIQHWMKIVDSYFNERFNTKFTPPNP